MSSISRCHQVSICKLTNGLWNTNKQNHRYYGTPNNCPYCFSPESLVHVFTCNAPQASSHRQEAIKTFQGELDKLKTHSNISETIISGLGQWAQSINNTASRTSAPFKGSLNTLDILLTKAFTEQNTDIGWVPLLQGKIRKYWIEAYEVSLPKSPHTTKQALIWGGKVILALWSLSKTIWKQRNKEIYGHSMQETKVKKGQKLEKQAKYFYTAYRENPFIILQRDRHLFNNELDQHLLLPHEHQAAWLRSVKEAILVRKQHDEQAESLRKQWFKDFFIKKPTLSPSKSDHSIAQPSQRKPDKSGKPTIKQSLKLTPGGDWNGRFRPTYNHTSKI